MNNWITDGSHVLVTGRTGSGKKYGGKTSTTHFWADKLVERGHYTFAIAFSPKGGNYHKFAEVGDEIEAGEAIKAGARKIEWSPDIGPGGDLDLSEVHTRAVQFANGLNGSVVFVHDDAVTYSGSDGLSWSCALAGNPGRGDNEIKSLVVTQDPWDLPRQSVRSNLTTMVWVGPTDDEAKRYFQVMSRSECFETVDSRHSEPFMFSVIDGSDVMTFSGVPEEYS